MIRVLVCYKAMYKNTCTGNGHAFADVKSMTQEHIEEMIKDLTEQTDQIISTDRIIITSLTKLDG